MQPKPVALPRPRAAEAAATAELAATAQPELHLDDLLRRRENLGHELALVDAEIERVAIESICGNKDDTQNVETYDGSLGVPQEFVRRYEPPVGQLQWLDDLHQRFDGPGDSPGTVAGARWGSGGLFTKDLFLTAGHCFDRNGGGWQRPRREGKTIEPEEIATLMRVNFNYQLDGTNGKVRPGVPFPVLELVEYRVAGLDFAIARLGPDEEDRLPGEVFGTLQVAQQDLTEEGAMLCLIQHPSGRPKRVEAGPLFQNQGGRISYDSLDTEGGSSGSSILGPSGEIVGVHTNGGCSAFSGANYGLAIGTLRQVSSIVN